MTVSAEVKMAVDKIHEERDALAAAKKANDLQSSQIADSQAQITDLKNQIVALQPGHLSDEDKQALVDAVNDASDTIGQAAETSDQLADAVPANVDTSAQPAAGVTAPTPPPNDPDAPRPDPIAGTGMSGSVPLMPNSSFDPAGGVSHGPGNDGQPNQPPAITTVGGFVVAGGGSVQRAPGSQPDSPSSSVVVPTDPDAQAPASNADLAKSGLGDSSQNATLGADGLPVGAGVGIVQPATQAQQDAAQQQMDALKAERGAREANPLALSPDDLAKRQQADAGKGTADDTAKTDPAKEAQPVG